MSFSEHEDCMIWQCDDCGLTHEFPPDSFWLAHGELKSRGWQFIKDDGDGSWEHKCGKCKPTAAELLNRVPGQRLKQVN